MMRDILVVGAGGFGREVAAWLQDQLVPTETGGRFGGFIDDRAEALHTYATEASVIANLETVCQEPRFAKHHFVLAIGDPATRAHVAKRFLDSGRRLQGVIHPSAVIGQRVTLGEGCIVCPHTTLTCDIHLGRGVIVNAHSSIGHDARVGDWTTLSGHCEITGECVVGERVFFGCGARVIPRRSIGDGCLIGAGAVVMGNVRPGARVYGNPARPL